MKTTKKITKKQLAILAIVVLYAPFFVSIEAIAGLEIGTVFIPAWITTFTIGVIYFVIKAVRSLKWRIRFQH